jgi:hypothetical protein
MRYAMSNVIINKLRELDLQYPRLPEEEKNRLEAAKEMLMNE